MILVSGTKRSGTSMWMQVLQAAGLPIIGEVFSHAWAPSIRDANPRGFFESRLRKGVYSETNPDPRTGVFLDPVSTAFHAVKVFVPGLLRTEPAYLGRVVATLRDWRSYTASLRRLYEMEDRYLASSPLQEGETEEQRAKGLTRAQARRGGLPPPVEWWFDNHALLHDIAARRYPCRLVSYARVLADPEPEVRQVLAWIGRGDPGSAVSAVEPSLRTQVDSHVDTAGVLHPSAIRVFDDLYDHVHQQRPFDPVLLERMDALQRDLEPRWSTRTRWEDAYEDPET